MAATIGDNIRAERNRRRLNGDELAQRAGMSRSGLSDIETGKVTQPRLDTLVRIAAVLEMPISDLLPEPAAPGSTVSAANHDRPSTIHENQHDQHRREDARGDSDVSPSLGSEEKAARTRQGAKGHSAA